MNVFYSIYYAVIFGLFKISCILCSRFIYKSNICILMRHFSDSFTDLRTRTKDKTRGTSRNCQVLWSDVFRVVRRAEIRC